MLEIRNLTKEYRAGQPVLKNVSIAFNNGGVTAIIGASGTGKSTLIRCINRLVEPTSGEVIFENTNIVTLKGKALRAMRAKIGMVFQEYNLVERLSVMENVISGKLGQLPFWRVFFRKFEPHDIDKAYALLERVNLHEFANRRADALSGGQRQRVGICRALMQNPKLILADEPTSSLDPKTGVEIMELLSDIAVNEGIPVIINIHNVELAKKFATRIIGMAHGKVVFDGKPSELTAAHLVEIYGSDKGVE